MGIFKRVLRGGAQAVLSEVGADGLLEQDHRLPRARSAPTGWSVADAVVTRVDAARQTQASTRIGKGGREGYVSPTTIELEVVEPGGGLRTLRHHGELLSTLRPRLGDRIEVAYDPAADGFLLLADHAERAKDQIAWLKDLVAHGTESPVRVLEVTATGRHAHPNDPAASFVAEHHFALQATARDGRPLRLERRMWTGGAPGDEGTAWFREDRPDDVYAVFPPSAREPLLQALRRS